MNSADIRAPKRTNRESDDEMVGGKSHFLYRPLMINLSEKDAADRLYQNQTIEFR